MEIIYGLQNTTLETLNISDMGFLISGGELREIEGLEERARLKFSSNLLTAVENEQVVIHNGTRLLTKSESLDVLKGKAEEVILLIPNKRTGELERQTAPILAGDGKPRVLASHKPVIPGKEAYNYFTSRGDDGLVVASGTSLRVETTEGQACTAVDVHFSTDANPMELIYLFGGGISWENAGWGDEISLELRTSATSIIPKATASSLGLPVVYALDGERIKYVGIEQGTYALGGYPKWVPNFSKNGYWNLDKSALAAVPSSGAGEFDWYITEQFVGHYVNNMSVYKNNIQPIILDATEAAPIPYGMFIRLVAHNVSNTVWKVWAFLKMYRERLK